MSRKSSLSRILLSGACFAVAGAAGGVAYAQQGNTSQATNPNSDEIVVTAQRREETIQNVPIAVSAFSESQLQDQGLNGGYDLLQSIPNVNFSKGNFTGYNFQIRGIGAAVVAAGADAGVSIHLNNAPLLANRLFEADYYDIERVEVLRGPQGTLYGRNATGGVVNVITHQPTSQFEASLRAEYANYDEQRYTGILNIPLGDTLAFRLAATSLDRDGFGTNATLHRDIDGRDIWAARATLAWNPTESFRAWASYEHFNEDDNRLRTGAQLCGTDNGPGFVNGIAVTNPVAQGWFSQGCSPVSLYSPAAHGAVNSLATLGGSFGALIGMLPFNAYAGVATPNNLHDVSSAFDPQYVAQADVAELNMTLDVSPSLTLTSLTSYNEDHYFTFQDYNRLPQSLPFLQIGGGAPVPFHVPILTDPFAAAFPPNMTWYADGVFCDPQLGCDNHFRTFDISSADSTQWSEEIRLSSNNSGPFNFDVGAMYLDLNAEPVNYFVYSNTLSAAAFAAGLCPANIDVSNGPGASTSGCNYYLNRSNYELQTWAVDGEFYYQPTADLRFTLGARYTDDTKDVAAFAPILFAPLSVQPVTNQHVEFREWTGRLGFDWHLHPSFTDSTLLYAFYSRGYKGGGFNPPSSVGIAGIPLTFAPEFVNSYEVGLKNELFDRHLLFNLTGFHYDYTGYQVSRIVNRNSVNENIDATVNGVELETVFQPFEGWRFNATAGWLDSNITGGSFIDTFDRTQGDSTYTLIHDPFTAQNCIVPTAFFTAGIMAAINGSPGALGYGCADFATNVNPLGINNPANPLHSIEGIPANVSGNDLPNSPHYTANIGGQYNWALGGGWEATARADYYWQGASFARIYNTAADRIDSYDNVNLLFRIENPSDGLTFEIFGHNVADTTAITGVYLTDDSSGLFRNVFLNEPRTIGVRLMKQW